jgi:hypothetical protein
MIPSINIDTVHKKRITRVYISSPYTLGPQEENIKVQVDTFASLMDRGFYPFAPLLFHYVGIKHPRTYDQWMEQCLVWVLQCNAVLRLPGRSKGADIEVGLAKSKGIKVFYSVEELIEGMEA